MRYANNRDWSVVSTKFEIQRTQLRATYIEVSLRSLGRKPSVHDQHPDIERVQLELHAQNVTHDVANVSQHNQEPKGEFGLLPQRRVLAKDLDNCLVDLFPKETIPFWVRVRIAVCHNVEFAQGRGSGIPNIKTQRMVTWRRSDSDSVTPTKRRIRDTGTTMRRDGKSGQDYRSSVQSAFANDETVTVVVNVCEADLETCKQ